MTQEITYGELYNVYGACNQVVSEMRQKQLRAHGQFLQFVLTNKDRAYKILEQFEKERPTPSEEVREFWNKVNEAKATLVRKEGEKDEEFNIRKVEVEQKEQELREEYKEVIDKWEEKQKEFEGKLDNKTKFNSMQIKQGYLPDNMDVQIMEILHKYVTTTE